MLICTRHRAKDGHAGTQPRQGRPAGAPTTAPCTVSVRQLPCHLPGLPPHGGHLLSPHSTERSLASAISDLPAADTQGHVCYVTSTEQFHGLALPRTLSSTATGKMPGIQKPLLQEKPKPTGTAQSCPADPAGPPLDPHLQCHLPV